MLNSLQKHHLKSLAHAKKPVVIIGSNGLTPPVLNEINAALSHHELIKIRANAETRRVRAEIVKQICELLEAETVQRVGHTATLFRRNHQKPRVHLP
jgi:RNA-binding protein